MSDQTQVRNVPGPAARQRGARSYQPTVGPRLRLLLVFIFAAVALLGATGIYLLALRLMDWRTNVSHETPFSLWMFLLHLVVGVAVLIPFLWFGVAHFLTARKRPNKVAVRLGILLFIVGLSECASGVALLQLDILPQLPTGTVTRWVVYWLHVVIPAVAVYTYVLHRRAGPAIRWRWGLGWGAAVALFVVLMLALHAQDPRRWYAQGSPEGEKYFEPSRARTVDANYIPAQALMMDEYCLKCHADIYNSHIHSAHKFSSFNNPAYLFSVTETRQTVGVRASRWCAGCHDPVPFFSGAFDDPNFDMRNHPTASAGITCTVCHAMTHINSRSGNADYTIEEPLHYPFAYSDNPVLQWVNNQLVKGRPEFHKQTFLKPFHRENEKFCSTCHKVGVPMEVNHYKEFLRGQNHPDSFFLSGVSGQGARSFYYPEKAKKCSDCHMPLQESNDFGNRDFDGSGKGKIHNHLFVGANTGVATLVKFPGWEKVVNKHAAFLRGGIDGKSPALRIDIFGLKHLPKGNEGVAAPLLDDQPLRPNLPRLKPGGTYLAEVVVRTLNMGHHFTQGTADSNEVWVELTLRSGGKVIARSGDLSQGEDRGQVDKWSHFINALVLDRHGNRIDRRNPQDIFTPLYDHQIPPGAAQVVHYQFTVPADIQGPVEIEARVRYRKFDYTYMQHVFGNGKVPQLPIVDLCADQVILPVLGVAEDVPAQKSPVKPAWQRWNDYGIGCFLEGGPDGKEGGELGQAEKAFTRLLPPFERAEAAHAHGYLNLARVHFAYGKDDLKAARAALTKAQDCKPPAPWWTVSWYYGLINMHNGQFAQAANNFELILDPKNRDPARGFDFTKDWVVINKLGETYYQLGVHAADAGQRDPYLRKAVAQFEKTLALDPENVTAHDFLHKTFRLLSGPEEEPTALLHAESAEEKTLTQLANAISDPKRFPAARQSSAKELLQFLPAAAAKCRPGFLAGVRQQLIQAATDGDDWMRLSVYPLVTELDIQLLNALPILGQRLTDGSAAARLSAAAELVQVLKQLGQPSPPPEVTPLLAGVATFPKTGLAMNFGLLGLADKGYLKGPLPPPRLLKLKALRQQLRPLFEEKDETVRGAAAEILSRIHLLMHGIYKLDENAAARAVGIHRQNFPAAEHASHAIVIHELK